MRLFPSANSGGLACQPTTQPQCTHTRPCGQSALKGRCGLVHLNPNLMRDGFPKSASFMRIFPIELMFCFLLTNLISSTCTDKNSPFSRSTHKHSQFGTFPRPYFSRTLSNCRLHIGTVNRDRTDSVQEEEQYDLPH